MDLIHLEFRFNPKNRKTVLPKIEKLKKELEIISTFEQNHYICFHVKKPISSQKLNVFVNDKSFYFVKQFKL